VFHIILNEDLIKDIRKIFLYYTLFYSIRLRYDLFYSIVLFCSILFYSILFYSILFDYVLIENVLKINSKVWKLHRRLKR